MLGRDFASLFMTLLLLKDQHHDNGHASKTHMYVFPHPVSVLFLTKTCLDMFFSKACIFIVERNCCFKIVREFHDSGSTLKIFEVHVTLC